MALSQGGQIGSSPRASLQNVQRSSIAHHLPNIVEYNNVHLVLLTSGRAYSTGVTADETSDPACYCENCTARVRARSCHVRPSCQPSLAFTTPFLIQSYFKGGALFAFPTPSNTSLILDAETSLSSWVSFRKWKHRYRHLWSSLSSMAFTSSPSLPAFRGSSGIPA